MSDETGLPPLEPAPEGLEGKTASEPEVVRWVARHIDVPRPRPSDCPDPFAWTLLRQCRASKAFAADFTRNLWAKLIPSRSQLEQTTSGEIDGTPTLKLISKIERMRAKATGEQAVSRPPKVALCGEPIKVGLYESEPCPNPQPCPIHNTSEVPDAFADYDPEEDDL